MSEWAWHFYFFIAGAAALLMVLGLGVAVVLPGMDRWSKHFFFAFFAVLVVSVVCFIAEMIVWRAPGLAWEEQMAGYLDSLLSLSLMPMLTVYILRCCGESREKSPLFYAVLGMWLLYFILLSSTWFSRYIFYIAADGQYMRGPGYPLVILPLIAIALLNLHGVMLRRNRLSRRQVTAFLIYLLPMTAAMVLQVFFDAMMLVDLGIIICALTMFGIILSEQIEHYMRQRREIASQQARIMVLQMRPHFIYNTMTSIYYLCEQNPKMAQQVTLDFTTYLRKNFTALASGDTIPFSEELEHTRAYLAVEQAQFEDSLFVDYDTPHTRFRLPPLTLQPIVENAVKHGMDPDSEPLRILIQTRETEAGSEILVQDNGTGFETTADGGIHIALENIRQRLEMMCSGKLTISPRQGGGTEVRVVIP